VPTPPGGPESKGNNHESPTSASGRNIQGESKRSSAGIVRSSRSVNDREMRIATFAKPQADEISPKSSLVQFKKRYKQFPKTGMKVDVVTDENSYWKIAL